MSIFDVSKIASDVPARKVRPRSRPPDNPQLISPGAATAAVPCKNYRVRLTRLSPPLLAKLAAPPYTFLQAPAWFSPREIDP